MALELVEGNLYHSPPVDAGWSSLAARRAHNPKVAGSNPAPATRFIVKGPRRGLFIKQNVGDRHSAMPCKILEDAMIE